MLDDKGYEKRGFFRLHGLEPRTWAKYQAEDLIKASKQISVQIDLDPILRLRQIVKPIIYDSHLKSDAHLSLIKDGFRISMNSWYQFPNRHRRWRFTIAHEIGHTLFYDLSVSPPRHLRISGLTTELEEQCCSYFATELLMPENQVTSQYHSITFNQKNPDFITTMLQLAKMFDVSPETLCLRVINELSLWNGLLLACQWDSKPSIYNSGDSLSNLETTMAWRVVWRVFSQEPWAAPFIPNPNKKEGLFPKLNWPQVESILDEMKSGQIRFISLFSSEIGKIGNLRKSIYRLFGDRPITIWLFKNDQNIPEIWPEEMNSFINPNKIMKTAYIAIDLGSEK